MLMQVNDITCEVMFLARMLTEKIHNHECAEKDCCNQAEIVAFLSDPKSFEPTVTSVKRIDTHAAIIFLAGKRAYKIKRAVRYPYLDFSTLEKRREFCEREVGRNKVTAPDIYVAAVPIVRTSTGALAINGPGEPVEWAVVMNRFEQDQLFDELAKRNALDTVQMCQLADTIAEYHAWAPVSYNFDSDSCFDEIISTVVSSLSSAVDLIGLDAVKVFAKRLLQHQTATSEILRKRLQDGMVRRCHGDLHLGNIVLWKGWPTLFDAIEFSDEIATQDVLFDLAFVLMDLWHRGLNRQANLLLNRYLGHPESPDDLSGLAALPLFMSLRAGIRAMVCLDRLPFADTQRNDVEKSLRQYFQLAQELLIDDKPRLIAIGGRSGTGKSTLAANIAHEIGRAPGAVWIRSDVERKRMFGLVAEQTLGRDAYTESVTGTVYRRAVSRARNALEAGQSVIVDATFLEFKHREMIEEVGQKNGFEFVGLWLEASPDYLLDRVEARRCDASDANTSVVQRQIDRDPGHLKWHVLNAEQSSESLHTDALQIVENSQDDTN